MARRRGQLVETSRAAPVSGVVERMDVFCGLAGTSAKQNRNSCLAVGEFLQTMRPVLTTYSVDDQAMRSPLRRLSAALDDAVALVRTCQSSPGYFSGHTTDCRERRIKAADTRIRDCFNSLSLLNQARIISQNEQLQLAADAAAIAAPPPHHHGATYFVTLTDEQFAAAIAAFAAAPRRRPTYPVTLTDEQFAAAVAAAPRRRLTDGPDAAFAAPPPRRLTDGPAAAVAAPAPRRRLTDGPAAAVAAAAPRRRLTDGPAAAPPPRGRTYYSFTITDEQVAAAMDAAAAAPPGGRTYSVTLTYEEVAAAITGTAAVPRRLR